MEETKYYCDLCKKEAKFWEFIHVEIKCSYGYNSDYHKSGITGGTERMNICSDCSKNLGFKKNGGAKEWCNGVRKMYLGLKSRIF